MIHSSALLLEAYPFYQHNLQPPTWLLNVTKLAHCGPSPKLIVQRCATGPSRSTHGQSLETTSMKVASVMSDSLRPHGLHAARQASLSITNSQTLLKLMSIELVMPSNHLNLCHPLLLPPSIIPSIRVFSNESVLRIRWPKYWSFSFNITPSKEHSGLISSRLDW